MTQRGEHEQEAAYRLLKDILDNVADPIFVKDHNYCWIDGNKAFWELMGGSADKFLGRNDYDFFPKEEADVFREKDSKVFQTGAIDINEEYFTDSEGERHILSTKKAMFLNGKHEQVLVGIIRDITAQKRLELLEKQEAEGKWLRSIADAVSALIWVVDAGKRLIHVNKTWLDFTGCTPEQEQNGWAENIHPDDAPHCLEVFATAFGRQEPFEAEYRLRQHDGAYRWMMQRGVPRYVNKDEFAGYIGTCVDIQEQVEARQAKEEVIEQLITSNTELERFAYICSHDLQEPLRMIANYMQRLEKHLHETLDDKARHYMQYVLDGAARARELINDVLNYARVGTDVEKISPIDSGDTLDTVLHDLSQQIQDAGAAVTHDALPVVPMQRTHMRQLFQNLISNGIKYRASAPPEIHIGAVRREDHWLFSVRDNGIGISPEYQHKLFTIFQRLHSRQEYPGTGVGLATCKKIVQQYRGKIWVESRAGEGATFYFTLPMELASVQPPHGPQ